MEIQSETIFRSKLLDIYVHKHLPLHVYCFESISEFATRPCLIDGTTGEITTYAGVELASRRNAAGLHKLGVRQHDVIMLLLPNCLEFVYAFLGASYIGATTAAANPFFTSAEIAKQAKAAAARVIITHACHVDKVRGLACDGHARIVCVNAPPEGCLHFLDLSSADEEWYQRWRSRQRITMRER